MEVARLLPFLNSTILFSLTSDFDKHLKKELWLCHSNMKFSMEELNNMTVADRRAYIALHNKQITKEKEEMEKHRYKR